MTTTNVRHGLYLPAELLDQIRVLANREGKSINKQIEEIIRDWLGRVRKGKTLSRKDILNLPLNRRRELLEAQAIQIQSHYSSENQIAGGESDFFEYDK